MPNGNSVMLEIYLDYKFQWPQEGLNCKSLASLAPYGLVGLGNYFVCKRFAFQTLLWSLEFVIQTTSEHDTIVVWNLARSWSISPMQNPFKPYNDQMGEVDLFDQLVANYRVRIRSKKWWWPFLTWSLYDLAVSSWRLYRKLTGNNAPLLKFIRELMLKSWEKYGNNPSKHSLNTSGIARKILKLAARNHVLVRGVSKYCWYEPISKRHIRNPAKHLRWSALRK